MQGTLYTHAWYLNSLPIPWKCPYRVMYVSSYLRTSSIEHTPRTPTSFTMVYKGSHKKSSYLNGQASKAIFDNFWYTLRVMISLIKN